MRRFIRSSVIKKAKKDLAKNNKQYTYQDLIDEVYDGICDNYRPYNFDTVNEFLDIFNDHHAVADIALYIIEHFDIEEHEQLINDFVGDAFKALKQSYDTYHLHMNNPEEDEEDDDEDNGEEWNDDCSLRDAEFPEEDEDFSNNYNNVVKKYKNKLLKIFK